MSSVTIKGIPVIFPFPPYDIQVNYMEKVIDCLQNGQNGVLESPTGTGKTLSLLCASLAWLEMRKAQAQAHSQPFCENNDNLNELDSVWGEESSHLFLGIPTIIYASRTHSQLSQAMQELKRTKYNYMKAAVLGSREQMCINQEVLNEKNNSLKVRLCRLKVKGRDCHYYNSVESKKDDPAVTAVNVMDIEDLVKIGQCHKFCSYYMAKELKQQADIVFMPYNYLLDSKVRKALGVELFNNIVILDEAHNIEKVCEEAASIQLKSTDITLCIDEVTAVMKAFTGNVSTRSNVKEVPKDFTPEEVCVLKQMFLDFQKVLDDIVLKTSSPEGTYFEGNYIFDMFNKSGINDGNYFSVISLIEKLIEFLAIVNEGGNGISLFLDLLTTAYTSDSPQFKQKIQRCYKVHVSEEEPKKNFNDWLSNATSKKSRCRVLSYWCFHPGFGMNMLMDQGVHCVILTSGTLAPLKPLISELELNVGVQTENPHIVQGDQVCLKIMAKGPDRELLNSNYQNRDNPKYLRSLGSVILNLIRSIPGGVLIFFPSYPMMQKCQQFWQGSGAWEGINQVKPIYVEPTDKIAFNCAVNDYYAKIQDPKYKGAIFMGVFRGKISEGLDFADINGRAVFITGLPYPPLKDPRIILKKRYLDLCNSKNKEYLNGNDWYMLEATRAINQAVGRVIRHKDDYGAIILVDSRFDDQRIKDNMSKWLQKHIKGAQNFGEIVRDLKIFFQNAQAKFPTPTPKLKEVTTTATATATSTLPSTSSVNLVTIHERKSENLENISKKNNFVTTNLEDLFKEYIIMAEKALDKSSFTKFHYAISRYKLNLDINYFIICLEEIFLPRPDLRYIIKEFLPYIHKWDQDEFQQYCKKM